MIVFLDRNSLDDYLANWRMMESTVDIWFLGRGIDYLGGQKHWAWLLIGKNFFCTLEFGGEGIVIQYFNKERGIKTACSAIMGNDNGVHYNDKYKTRMNFAEILEYVVAVKNSWRACDYHGLLKNCRNFVILLGKKLDSTFKPAENPLDTVLNDTAMFNKYINIV